MSIIHNFYNWTLRQAEKPYIAGLIFLIAFIEPFLIPLPPDTLLIPAALARRDKAFRLAAICTLGSVLGGLVGYSVGALGMATVGKWIVETYGLQEAFDHFRQAFRQWGALVILAKGLTPIPFVLVAVASGATHFNIFIFAASAAVTRGARFFLEAFLIFKFGEPIRSFIEKYLTIIFLGVLAAIVLGVWVVVH